MKNEREHLASVNSISFDDNSRFADLINAFDL